MRVVLAIVVYVCFIYFFRDEVDDWANEGQKPNVPVSEEE